MSRTVLDSRFVNRSPLAAVALALLCWGCGDSGDRGVRGTEAAVVSIDEREAGRLRALGYVDVVESARDSDPTGVLDLDAMRAQQGLTHITNTRGCSAQLIALDGTVVHSWSHQPCFTWGNSVLLPDGDLLVIHRSPPEVESAEAVARARELLRLSWNGDVVWRRRIPVHHDVELTPDGRVATLSYRHRVIPEFHEEIPVREDFVEVLSADGEILETVSLLDLLRAGPEPFPLKAVPPRFAKRERIDEVDLTHANSLEWMPWLDLAQRNPLYAPGNVLLCLRGQDAVLVVDWRRRHVVWSWGPGELSGPHDATWLPDGNLLIFDNGLGRKWSRVVELDPLARRIVWEYRAPEPTDLFTAQRGAAQRLSNGNTLITASGSGRAFEVTPGGEVVWDFVNPNRSNRGKSIVIVRARRLRETSIDARRFERVD